MSYPLSKELQEIEDEIMIHRYRYYIMYDPVITDYQYDMLDHYAVSVLPPESPVNQVGSELPSSYSESVRTRAINL